MLGSIDAGHVRAAAHTGSRRMRLTFLALLAVAQIVTLVVSSLTLGSASNDALRDRLSADLLKASRESTAQITSYLDGPRRLTSLLADLTLSIGEQNDGQLESTFLWALENTPHATGAFVGRANGSFLFVSKRPDGGYTTKIIEVVGSTRTVTRNVRRSAKAAAVSETVVGDTFDPRTRPWFTLATQQKGSAWTEPYTFASSQQPGITTARMIDPDRPGSPVVGVDIDLAEIHSYVETLRVSAKGTAVIVNRRSERLGGAARSSIPAALAAPEQPPVVTHYRSGKQEMAMVVQRIPGSPGWRIAVASPESDYFAESGRLQNRLLRAFLLSGLVTAFAAIALVMLLKRRVEGIAQKAHVDKLTGVLNRARMMELTERRMQRNQRSGQSTYVCLLDIDFYKEINDTYGHAAGDVVLQTISDRLARTTRVNDLVGRYGGDEFLVVFDGVDMTTAKAMIEEIRHRLGDEPIDLGERLVAVTTSAGLAVATGTEPTLHVREVVAEADKALYAAKRDGRNKLVLAP
jgi:diguanylate cyclase (GGDEF)-like protein